MKISLLGTAALLFQSATVVNIGAPARPEHFRYRRDVHVLAQGSGMACALLDATVLGHTASAAHSDLRIFRSLPGEGETEVPYALTESGPEPVADTAAAVEHAAVRGNELSFDLRMPARAYSEVRLRLPLENFIATATAEGRGHEGRSAPLGSVALFDLTAQHLGRWTSLLLGETSWPILHIVLDMRTPEGQPRTGLSPGMILGADVPPSRARQTRFVPVVSVNRVEQRGPLTIALLRVPAHVPVERVTFALAPGFGQNFSREVTVSARPEGAPITDTEALDAGAIAHVSLPSGDPRLFPITLREDGLDATLGATLARPATVLVAVDNHGRPPLPIRLVTLQMRERKICFFADREGAYMLRYGDPALTQPEYDESALIVPAQPLEADLGPEQVNPHFHVRLDARPYVKRHPELFWLALLLCAGMMGGSALHHVQHRRV